MKLELKHLTSYKLGLDGIEVWDKENLELTTIDKIDFNSNRVKTNVLHSDWQDLDTVEMALIPLEDLTKKLKFNETEFIPAIALYPFNCEDTEIIEHYTDGRVCMLKNNEGCFMITGGTTHRFEDNMKGRGITNFNDYELTNQLIEWGFDVFGLIPKGLAIDKNKIT